MAVTICSESLLVCICTISSACEITVCRLSCAAAVDDGDDDNDDDDKEESLSTKIRQGPEAAPEA